MIIFKRLKLLLNKSLNIIANMTGNIQKKVVFESNNGIQYSCNPRAISEKMHLLYPDYELIWGMQDDWYKKNNLIPDYVRVVPINSWEYRKQRATAVAYIRNEAMTVDLVKNKNQLYIQTWHGDRGVKKILYEAWKGGKRPFPVMDEKLTDIFVIGSDYAAKRIRAAFRYFGKTLLKGCPRNDCLVVPVNSEKVRLKIGVKVGQKILLYAPTFRQRSILFQANVNIKETLDRLKLHDGHEWICLVRAHPKSNGLTVELGPNIIDVSHYPDMADLLMIADVLITDYSSSAGDFILRKKPLILAQFDLEQYKKEDRSFHVNPNEIGFLIAKTQEELNYFIDTMTDKDFADNCEELLQYFGTHETGHAAEAVCCAIDEYYQSVKN